MASLSILLPQPKLVPGSNLKNDSIKVSNKDDNKGIKLIKEFVETLYKEMTEERNKRK